MENHNRRATDMYADTPEQLKSLKFIAWYLILSISAAAFIGVVLLGHVVSG